MNRAPFFSCIKRIATLGNIGYFPAPGTCATVATVPLVVVLKLFFSQRQELVILVAATAAALIIIDYALQLFPYPTHASDNNFQYDPQQIVLDEVVGYLWALFGSPLTFRTLVISFVLFRFFDIVKPLGIREMQRLPRAWGIVADDVLAGIYTALIIYVFFAQ